MIYAFYVLLLLPLLCLFSSCRLVIPPIIMLTLMAIIQASSPPPAPDEIGQRRLMMMLVLVESAVPSAQILMVCLQQLEMSEIAERLSYFYIYHYLIALVTITLVVSAAISLLYY